MTGETALVLGGRLPAIAATRALAKAGYRVAVGESGVEYSPARHSRYCREVWRHPPATDGEFLDALVSFLARRRDVTVILPIQERYVALLASARARLPDGVTLAAPESNVVETCLDKSRMYALAREVGVPYHPIRIAVDLEGLALAADEVGYPCVIRPSRWSRPLPGRRKAYVCSNLASVRRLVDSWPEGHGSLLVQRYVDGLRSNVYFAARSGQMLASVHTRILRTDRADGTGNVVEGITVPPDSRLMGYCDALLGRLGYTGVGTAQFIVPMAGDPSFLEINPRHGGAYAIAERCGLELTVAAIALASGSDRWRPHPDFRYPVARRYVWTSRDIYGLAVAASRREVDAISALRWLGRSLQAAARPAVHLTWAWRDPLPTIAVYAHLATLGPWRR